MHRMLLRQLNRFFGPADSVPAHLRNFINAVDEAYEASEAEQKHLGNSYDQAARDLAERNRLLAQRSKEVDALKQCAVDCIIIADFEGRIVDANPAAQATLGRSLHDLRGQVIYDAIISDPHREGHQQLLSRHLTGHETGVSRIETRCLRPGAGEFPVEMAITVVRGEGPSQIIVCFRDVSARKQAAGAPAPAAPPPQQAAAPSPDLIVRLTEMLQEPLAHMIQSVEQLEETPLGDPQRFDQVLHNLVGNAIKFTDHGEVMVHVTSSENTDSEVTIRCAVKDTGRRIPQDQLDKLYKQLSDPNSAWSQSGRGLAICQQLITAMGGTLGMESQPGQGSTFWFTVKMRKQHVVV